MIHMILVYFNLVIKLEYSIKLLREAFNHYATPKTHPYNPR